jgi:Raf kinase inhibitor-like YbhB/YbcL family protein
MSLILRSPAFKAYGPIDARYTCEGEDISPALSWSGVHEDARSLALIVDDPDAPRGGWVHWVVYNLPSALQGLPEASRTEMLPEGTLEGLNDWRRTGYGGPCPPMGRHRYFFTLYALDCLLPDLDRPTKGQLERAMQGHVLGKTELMGTYSKRAAE